MKIAESYFRSVLLIFNLLYDVYLSFATTILKRYIVSEAHRERSQFNEFQKVCEFVYNQKESQNAERIP